MTSTSRVTLTVTSLIVAIFAPSRAAAQINLSRHIYSISASWRAVEPRSALGRDPGFVLSRRRTAVPSVSEWKSEI